MIRKLKNKLGFLANTPVHPQWLLGDRKKSITPMLQEIGQGKLVLDIGCSNKWPEKYLHSSCTYIGLDYYETAENWYGTKPDVYGDALRLPMKQSCFDAVLLLDVLEHIKDTDRLLNQIRTVLKPNGLLIVSIPFMYPLHDKPRDYIRLTVYGIEELASRYGFAIDACRTLGSPIITSTLLLNISLTKLVINWISSKSIASVFSVLLPFSIIVNNLVAKTISVFEKEDSFMPHSYQFMLRKI